MSILIAEDETIVRKMNERILSRLGFHVHSASDGHEALQVLNELDGKIDLILTDVIMPNMNGQQLAQKAQELYPEIKVLFTSGYTNEIIAKHNILEEGIHFIAKPYSPSDLKKALVAILAS